MTVMDVKELARKTGLPPRLVRETVETLSSGPSTRTKDLYLVTADKADSINAALRYELDRR